MLKEVLLCIEKEEKNKEIECQIKTKRDELNYLINTLYLFSKKKINKCNLIILTVFLIFCELAILFAFEDPIKTVLTSIVAPFIISSIVVDFSSNLVIESEIIGIEKEILKICLFIKRYDKLNKGEKYILDYIYDFKSKKYTRKNKFKIEEALRH